MALVVGGSALAAGALTYTIVRPYFNKTVNCHFCNSFTKVKYADQNCWTCPTCDQYNGFTDEGDYNQPVNQLPSRGNSFVQNQKQSQPTKNTLCKACNLNQELKISQLSSFTGDDFELEEYQAHLERVYRLCAECEDRVSSKLSALDSLLAPGVIEHRLETSRLSSSLAGLVDRPPRFQTGLCDLQVLLSVILFFVILNPRFHVDIERFTSPQIGVTLNKAIDMFDAYNEWLQLCVGMLLALISLLLVRLKTASIISIAPVLTIWFNYDLSVKLTAACLSATLLPLSPVTFKKAVKKVRKKRVVDTYSAKLIEPEVDNLDEARTGNTSSESKSSEVGRLFTGILDKSQKNTLPGVGSLLFAPVRMSPPVRSGEEVSLSHEFAMENSGDCDLASLSLGEEEPVRPTRLESPHFSPRMYSPENKSGIKFSPAKPVLRPSRLTSWVAGGYWTPPNTQGIGESLSRSSSQSSGFVSGSVAPSVQNFPISQPLNNYISLPNSPRNSVCGDCERCSLLSEPMLTMNAGRLANQMSPLRRPTVDEGMSVSSLDFGPQNDRTKSFPDAESTPLGKRGADKIDDDKESPKSLNDKLSLTITITPVGFLLCASLAVNLTVMYIYMIK